MQKEPLLPPKFYYLKGRSAVFKDDYVGLFVIIILDFAIRNSVSEATSMPSARVMPFTADPEPAGVAKVFGSLSLNPDRALY